MTEAKLNRREMTETICANRNSFLDELDSAFNKLTCSIAECAWLSAEVDDLRRESISTTCSWRCSIKK